jgi:hypothetical protein
MTDIAFKQEIKRSSPLVIALAWLIVGIPAAWGVEQTFKKSMALFGPSSQSTTPLAAPASASISK